MIDSMILERRIDDVARLGLLSPDEVLEAKGIALDCFPLADAFRLADSIHLNVKVERAGDEFAIWAQKQNAREENAKPGYTKYAFSDGVHVIRSAIDISQEDLIEARSAQRRKRPFLDHIGIDLRQETARVRDLFNAIPFLASRAGWPAISQGESGKGGVLLPCSGQREILGLPERIPIRTA